jgi:hypothetical protein
MCLLLMMMILMGSIRPNITAIRRLIVQIGALERAIYDVRILVLLLAFHAANNEYEQEKSRYDADEKTTEYAGEQRRAFD